MLAKRRRTVAEALDEDSKRWSHSLNVLTNAWTVLFIWAIAFDEFTRFVDVPDDSWPEFYEDEFQIALLRVREMIGVIPEDSDDPAGWCEVAKSLNLDVPESTKLTKSSYFSLAIQIGLEIKRRIAEGEELPGPGLKSIAVKAKRSNPLHKEIVEEYARLKAEGMRKKAAWKEWNARHPKQKVSWDNFRQVLHRNAYDLLNVTFGEVSHEYQKR